MGFIQLLLQKRHEGKQNLQKAISCWLPDEKIMILSRSADGLAILRRTGSQKQRSIKHRDIRPHLLAEVADYTPDAEVITYWACESSSNTTNLHLDGTKLGARNPDKFFNILLRPLVKSQNKC
jgi:hypothetical protein